MDMVTVEECRKIIQEYCKYSDSHKLTIFTKHSMVVFKEVCYSPPQIYGCADNLGSVILVIVISVCCCMQLPSMCWKPETEFGVGSVLGIETSMKHNVSFLNSCKSTSLHNFWCRDKYLHLCFFVSASIHTIVCSNATHGRPWSRDNKTVCQPALRTYEIPQRTMALILSPQATARLGCILLRRTQQIIDY